MTEAAEVKGNGEEENYLGSWKTKPDAEEGLANMQAMVDSQGNEVGTLRRQVESNQQVIDGLQQTPALESTPAAPDYSKEVNNIQGEMANLDVDAPGYQKDLMGLMAKSNALSAKVAKEETLAAATEVFKKELNERDVQATHSAFYKDNPDFNTPEMQTRIRDYIARDTSGMSDPLVAYREIQRDEAIEAVKTLTAENAELKRVAELAKGTDLTGKVVTKGHSPPVQKQPKATGAALDQGMQGALEALRG